MIRFITCILISCTQDVSITKVNEVDSANKLNGAKLKVSIEEE